MPAPRVHVRGAELPGVQGEDGRRRRRRRDEVGRAQGLGRRHRVVFDEGGKRVHSLIEATLYIYQLILPASQRIANTRIEIRESSNISLL